MANINILTLTDKGFYYEEVDNGYHKIDTDLFIGDVDYAMEVARDYFILCLIDLVNEFSPIAMLKENDLDDYIVKVACFLMDATPELEIELKDCQMMFILSK